MSTIWPPDLLDRDPIVVRGRFDVDGGGLVVVVVGLFLDDDGVLVQEVWTPDGAHGARRYEL